MQEILKNELSVYKFDEGKQRMIKEKTYHIFQEGDIIFVYGPLPVKQLRRLRKILWYNDIQYKDLIIGEPYKVGGYKYVWN